MSLDEARRFPVPGNARWTLPSGDPVRSSAHDAGAIPGAVELAVAPETWAPPSRLLDEIGRAERAHAERLTSPRRRQEYLAGHALLNRVARRFGATVDISRAEDGRPLVNVDGRSHAASISHANGLVAAAVGTTDGHGIDLEFPRPARAWQAVERRFGWGPAPDEDRRTHRWCLWEASGKARGRGVFRSDDPVFDALLAGGGGDEATTAWRARGFRLPDSGWLVVVWQGAVAASTVIAEGLPVEAGR